MNSGELCTAAGDKVSLAIGMAGLVVDHAFQGGRVREASRLASEAMALIESIGDPTLTVGLSFGRRSTPRFDSGQWCDVLQWSLRVIDLADGDPSNGNFLVGSPLASRLCVAGHGPLVPGSSWMAQRPTAGLAMARSADPISLDMVVVWVYFLGIPGGVLRADDSAVREINDALRIVERSGDDARVDRRPDDAGPCAGAPLNGGGA